MKFIRRADLTVFIRLQLALTMQFRDPNRWGVVAELAREHNVSRQFLYNNKALLLQPFTEKRTPQSDLSVEFVQKLILCMRLHGNSSIDGISKTLKEMGLGPASMGYVSQFLHNTAASCSLELPCKGDPVPILVDEIFINDRPVFVTMEALSHSVLDIALMPDRKAETWVNALRKLQNNGLEIEILVKDQGSSLKAAAQTLGLPERADLFHLLKPFDPYLPSLERHAYGAIEQEYERERIFGNRKSEKSLEKQFASYDSACEETRSAIRDSDNYDYLHQALHDAFNSFTAEGHLRTRTMAEGDIEAALNLIETEFPSHQKIVSAVKFMRKNMADFWSYFEQLEHIIHDHANLLPEHTLQAACLAWQLEKKAMAVKGASAKKELTRQSKAQLEYVLTGVDEGLKTAIGTLFLALNANVRSSSPIEAINSIIRTYFNACRGQLTQESLTMLAFFLNHRIASRGKYKGSSPYERLSGIKDINSPIEQLLNLSSRALKKNPSTTAPSSHGSLLQNAA